MYSDENFSLTIDIIYIILEKVSLWKKVPLCSLLYYLLITAGYSLSLISIKLFITVSMMIGNIIDIYLLGIMVVLINWIVFISYSGFIIISFMLYLFLTRMELFLIILFVMESFSLIFQSLTLSNRLSINILAGSLLVTLICTFICFIFSSLVFVCILGFVLLLVYLFEIFNSFVQLFIFNLLSIEYLLNLF